LLHRTETRIVTKSNTNMMQ